MRKHTPRSMDHLFINHVEIFRKKKNKNPAGGFQETWVSINTAYIRISTFTPRTSEEIQQEKQQYPVTHRLYGPATLDIQEDDRVKYRGEVFQVDKPTNPSYMDHHIEMFARVLNVAELKGSGIIVG